MFPLISKQLENFYSSPTLVSCLPKECEIGTQLESTDFIKKLIVSIFKKKRILPKGVSTNPKDINAAFQSFYTNLYKASPNLNMMLCKTFIENFKLPSLHSEEAEEIGQPIQLQELKSALKGAKRNKTPGLDGIPSELLLKYFHILGPTLLQTINSAVERGAFHQQTNTAIISLLPKKGKDPLDCSNYRPISLLGADLKLYAKVLALCLERFWETSPPRPVRFYSKTPCCRQPTQTTTYYK